MKDRTVILVTHNTALTLPIARFVVTLKDGRVASQEVVRNASTEAEAEAQIEKAAATIDEEEALESEVNDEPALKKKDSVVSGKLVMDEEVQVGHVSWSASKAIFFFTRSSSDLHYSQPLCNWIGREIPCAILCCLARGQHPCATDHGVPNMVSGFLGITV